MMYDGRCGTAGEPPDASVVLLGKRHPTPDARGMGCVMEVKKMSGLVAVAAVVRVAVKQVADGCLRFARLLC